MRQEHRREFPERRAVETITVDKYSVGIFPPSFSAWAPQKSVDRQIALLMSGGVDSSVSAHLLREAGWEVLGITMKIPVLCDMKGVGCCGADAALVCNELGICHYFIDVTEAFEQLIIEPFRQCYSKGQTPNPCVECNSLVKFSLLWDVLRDSFGIDHLATGHYARVTEDNGRARLGRARDHSKDQSYVLYGIAAERLGRVVFPLGDKTKDEVRKVATQLGLSIGDKEESMELCFAGGGDYRGALSADHTSQAGSITDMQGNVIGTHQGIANYTIGQRRGLGYAAGKPVYVGRIDAGANTVALGVREEVSTPTVRANQIHRLIPAQLMPGARLSGKIRSYGDPAGCRVVAVDDNCMTVDFDEARFAPCPGQKLVLYNQNDEVVAGGTIIPALDESCEGRDTL